MTAMALDGDVDGVGRSHQRSRADREGADRQPRTVVHAVDLVDLETLDQSVLNHRLGAGTALLGRLEDHGHLAGEVAGFGEIARGAEQHRGMAVMAAGMHQARGLRGIGQPGRLLDRQRIHVGAQAEHLDLAAAGLAALDDADDAGLAQPRRDLVTAEFAQPVGHEGRGPMHLVEQLRVRMDIPPPGLDIGLQIGDAVDDGHGGLS